MKIRCQEAAVDGEVTDVLDWYGNIVEKFRGRKICLEERRNVRILVELLKAALAQRRKVGYCVLITRITATWVEYLTRFLKFQYPSEIIIRFWGLLD